MEEQREVDIAMEEQPVLIRQTTRQVKNNSHTITKVDLDGAVEENIEATRLDGARGAVMVAVTLIATMLFQSALSPPGGVWPVNSYDAKVGSFVCSNVKPCIAGTAVLAYSDSKSYEGFITINTWTLCLSLIIIMGLVCWSTADISGGFRLLGLSTCVLIGMVAITHAKAIRMLTPTFIFKEAGSNLASAERFMTAVTSTILVATVFHVIRAFCCRKHD